MAEDPGGERDGTRQEIGTSIVDGGAANNQGWHLDETASVGEGSVQDGRSALEARENALKPIERTGAMGRSSREGDARSTAKL